MKIKMGKTAVISNARVTRVLISIIKEGNKYFVEIKENNSEYFEAFKYNVTTTYYDNIEIIEEFLNGVLNNNTPRGSIYHVDINYNGSIVDK